MNEITGEDVLEGIASLEIYIPEKWTGEYVGHRLVQASDVLRRTPGRIGPKEYGNAWPDYVLDYGGIGTVMVRPTSWEIDLSEEALRWPARFLQDSPLHMDSVMLWATAKAYDRDAEMQINERRKVAEYRAQLAADLANAGLKPKIQEAEDAVTKWMASEYRKRKIALDCESERAERFERLKNQGRNRLETAMQKLKAVVPDPIAAMPGKVISVSTWRRMKFMGLNLLAERLDRARVAIR